MKKLLSLTLCLVSLLPLTSCKYETPDLSEYGIDADSSAVDLRSPYGMYDYSKRAFLSQTLTVYQSDIYYLDPYCYLKRVSLFDLKADYNTETEPFVPEAYSICPSKDHKHYTNDVKDYNCPDSMRGVYLIDAYESAGDFPIFYYSTDDIGSYDEKGVWQSDEGYHIFRYDTAKIERKRLIKLSDHPNQLMSYDDRIFIVTNDADNDYALHTVTKDGKESASITLGEGKLVLLGVHGECALVKDLDGTVYKVSLDLQSSEAIFQLQDDVSVSLFSWEGDDSAFVYGDYLYFAADLEVVPYVPHPETAPDFTLEPVRHDLRRLPLDDLTGEGELVAEDIFDFHIYGIVDGVLYYAPFVAGEIMEEGGYYNFTGGLLKGVDLETLQTVEGREDTGLYMIGSGVMSGDAMICDCIYEMRDFMAFDFAPDEILWRPTTYLYDIKTGAVFGLR